MYKSETQLEERLAGMPEDALLLAAALTAALVEYRRQTHHGRKHWHASAARANWRSIARWEQLQERG
jgi:hypothetical protein